MFVTAHGQLKFSQMGPCAGGSSAHLEALLDQNHLSMWAIHLDVHCRRLLMTLLFNEGRFEELRCVAYAPTCQGPAVASQLPVLLQKSFIFDYNNAWWQHVLAVKSTKMLLADTKLSVDEECEMNRTRAELGGLTLAQSSFLEDLQKFSLMPDKKIFYTIPADPHDCWSGTDNPLVCFEGHTEYQIDSCSMKSARSVLWRQLRPLFEDAANRFFKFVAQCAEPELSKSFLLSLHNVPQNALTTRLGHLDITEMLILSVKLFVQHLGVPSEFFKCFCFATIWHGRQRFQKCLFASCLPPMRSQMRAEVREYSKQEFNLLDDYFCSDIVRMVLVYVDNVYTECECKYCNESENGSHNTELIETHSNFELQLNRLPCIVHRASYGKGDFLNDVTAAVQLRVDQALRSNEFLLNVPFDRKSFNSLFGDPCLGVQKIFSVDYSDADGNRRLLDVKEYDKCIMILDIKITKVHKIR